MLPPGKCVHPGGASPTMAAPAPGSSNRAHLIGFTGVVVCIAGVGRNAVLQRQAEHSTTGGRQMVCASQGPPGGRRRLGAVPPNRGDLVPGETSASAVRAQAQLGLRGGWAARSHSRKPATLAAGACRAHLEVQSRFNGLHWLRRRFRKGWRREQVSALAGALSTGRLVLYKRDVWLCGFWECGAGPHEQFGPCWAAARRAAAHSPAFVARMLTSRKQPTACIRCTCAGQPGGVRRVTDR